MYTSGTTGRPKGVLVSHRMLRLSGEAVALVSAVRAGDVMFMWEPLYHIGGAQMIVLPLIRDVTLALVEHFSASRFWSQVHGRRREPHPFPRRHSADPAQAAPVGARSDARRAHRLGRRLPARDLAPFEQRFGVQIRECYGMTECSSITTYNDNGRGRLGRPAGALVSVELLGPAGEPVPAGRARRDRRAHLAARRDHARLSVEPGGDRARLARRRLPHRRPRLVRCRRQHVFPRPHDRQCAGARRERLGARGRAGGGASIRPSRTAP